LSSETPYTIRLPDDFDDEAKIIEAKGFFAGVTIVVGETTYRPEFYDETRLARLFQERRAWPGALSPR
jgi:hypothetical protein